MEKANDILPEGYEFKTTLHLKTGKIALYANVIALFCLVGGYAFLAIFMDSNFITFLFETGQHLNDSLILVLTILLGFAANILIELFISKYNGAGQAKIYFGLTVGITYERPLTKKQYLIANSLSAFLPAIVLLLLCFIYQKDCFYYIFVLLASNSFAFFLIYYFLLPYDNNALLKFQDGNLDIFTKSI